MTGATGNVGRALVERRAAADRPVRALTRDPQRAGLPGRRGGPVRTRPAWCLVRGRDQAVPVRPGRRRTDPCLLAAARAAGVRHVVLLSSGIIQEGADESHPIHVMHATAERQILDSGLAWTFLRPNAFAVNAFQWAPQIRAGDRVRGVFADGLGAPSPTLEFAQAGGPPSGTTSPPSPNGLSSTTATRAPPTGSPVPRRYPTPVRSRRSGGPSAASFSSSR
ncbi:SDR family oxidoreductase [Streptomyces sp. NPDC008343]|uniref:SDR family oxidoreductase n=1 Tax=Streptomyces sp. NPDC008343 TaxID=3364828 RepID=UPI0036EC7957